MLCAKLKWMHQSGQSAKRMVVAWFGPAVS